MRFAVVATCVAAVVAVPLAVEASGPRMSRSEFLAAVSCVARQSAGAPQGAFAAVQAQLNAEARRHAPATAAEARARALQAVNGAVAEDGTMLGADSAACEGAALIARAPAQSAA